MHDTKFVRWENTQISYVDQGEGLPLVCVHGFPLDHTMWSEQIGALAGPLRVIAPDLRGFGHSVVTEGTVTMEQMADDLEKLLDAIQVREPIVLCGLSMGGYVAWQFWKKFPDRLRALILCDTRATADTPAAAQGRHTQSAQVLQSGVSELAEGMLKKLFASQTHQQRPEVIEATRKVMLHTDAHGVAAALRGMAIRPDMSGELANLSLPVLVICGEEDAITPLGEMRHMADQIPDVRWITVPDAGHMAPLENPAVVNGAIRQFLEIDPPI